jgi:hypothetical protein
MSANVMKLTLAFLCALRAALAADPFTITHQFANRNAHSLIGLPMGSHKTLVEKDGSLRWSQWSLKRKPLDSPFGFSGQMDGALAIENFRIDGDRETPLQAGPQSLYQGRYPFVETQLTAGDLALEELAFAAEAGSQGLDAVRLRVTNQSGRALALETRLSGKHYNLPGHARQSTLVTRDGFEIVLVQPAAAACVPKINGLTLACRWTVPANSTQTLWLKVPYDLPSANEPAIDSETGEALLARARDSWQAIWAKGPQIHLPLKALENFFYSTIAYVLILTEYDAAGDFWILDGPGGYRQFWGRGEYFQARALHLLGRSDLARASLEHAFHIQMDDGEWDGPPISGWPSWDNIGGNAAGAWEYYRFTRDRTWLEHAYPHLLAAARWIGYHREESDLEGAGVPAGAKPVRRAIPWSCKAETEPKLQPGEKPYWSGLLPWSYGDSGIPEGHAFPHNFFALYAVECARKAAVELGKQEDAAWLRSEYDSYRDAIMASLQRSLKLEQGTPAYLPAMPVAPEAAWSQSFVSVYPTELFKPDDPLITGLLTRIERSMRQGLPTNMAWLGFGGVWPGNSMNVAEVYLRRSEVAKAAAMLVATLNHSYSTNVWREEIRVDKTVPTACPNSTNNRNLDNQMGTGDMPEAWANANLVNLVRDMLLLERDGALDVLAGIPADWIGVGDEISVRDAPTLLGGPASYRLSYPAAGKMVLELDAPKEPVDVIVRFPIPEARTIHALLIDGRTNAGPTGPIVKLEKVRAPTRVEIQF